MGDNDNPKKENTMESNDKINTAKKSPQKKDEPSLLKLMYERGKQKINEAVEKARDRFEEEKLDKKEDNQSERDLSNEDEIKESISEEQLNINILIDNLTPISEDFFWKYLQHNYNLELKPIFPDYSDRKNLDDDPERQRVWDFFFPLEKYNIDGAYEKINARINEKIRKTRKSYDKKVEQTNIQRTESQLDIKLKQKQSLEENIKEKNLTIAELEKRLLEEKAHLEVADLIKKNSSIQIPENITINEEKHFAYINDSIEKQISDLSSQIKMEKEQIEKLKIDIKHIDNEIENKKNEVSNLKTNIQEIQSKKDKVIQDLNDYSANFKNTVEKLKQGIPSTPNIKTIDSLFRNDLKHLQKKCVREAADELKIIDLTIFDKNKDEIPLKGFMKFVGPGELQSPDRIPTSYTPININLGKKAAETLKSLLRISSDNRLETIKPNPNHIKHLLARKMPEKEEGGYEIFYGVYHIEFLVLMEDNFMLYSFFYDFITGETIAEIISEVYYKDIIALEQRSEERVIPLSYQEDSGTLEIANIPTLRLILPGSESRTITFANKEYFIGHFMGKSGVKREKVQEHVDKVVEEAKKIAHAAVNIIRRHIRNKK